MERWDFDKAAATFIRLYRDQKLGDTCLDKELLRPYMYHGNK